jgi:hypothetical protein
VTSDWEEIILLTSLNRVPKCFSSSEMALWWPHGLADIPRQIITDKLVDPESGRTRICWWTIFCLFECYGCGSRGCKYKWIHPHVVIRQFKKLQFCHGRSFVSSLNFGPSLRRGSYLRNILSFEFWRDTSVESE